MTQVFSPSSNTKFRLALAVLAALGLALVLVPMGYARSWWETEEHLVLEQPVPFSHEHHVGGLGLDCRYCHRAVERSANAGLPAASVCMNCHRELWPRAEPLRPVRAAYARGAPLAWNRVYQVPDFVYFNHGIHVAKGVGCTTCHGAVDRMPLLSKAHSFQMRWCLECHRDPAPHLRPRDEVFSVDWKPGPDARREGERLAREVKLRPNLTDCTVCHR